MSVSTAPRTCTHAWHVAADGFPACKGDACLGTTIACGQGSIPCPRHGASPLLVVAPVLARDVVVGDQVTEVDTPDGPWYAVLAVEADGLVVEGAEAGEAQSLPVPLEVAPLDRVLVRRLPLADPASDSAAFAIDPLEVVAAPSGRFGFYRPRQQRWEADPVVQIVQPIARGAGIEWHPTPGRYYDRTVLEMSSGADLSIDHGQGWSMPGSDVAALKRFCFGGQRPLIEQGPLAAATSPAAPLTPSVLADGLSALIATVAGDLEAADVAALDAAFRVCTRLA